MLTTVWIVAQVKNDDGSVWELGGVFSSKEKAIAACTDLRDCIWEETVDKAYSRETTVPPDCYYPLRGDSE